jgi:transcriptional regulator with XRE-family HTH domain
MSRADGYDPLYEAVGERIMRARAATGLSQAKLAMQIGITRVSIVNIERGRQRTPLHILWQIAVALDVKPASLVPSPNDVATRNAPVQLDPKFVSYIEQAAQDDPATKRLLTDFVRRATTKIEGLDVKDD